MMKIVLLMLSLVVLVAADGVDNQAIVRLPSGGDDKGLADDAMAAAAASHGDEERPWECCDWPICTKSIPPICWCPDNVERCADACEDCKAVPFNPGRYVCMDSYTGLPGPTCIDEAQVMAQKAVTEEV